MAGEEDLLNMSFNEDDDAGEIVVSLPGDTGEVQVKKADDKEKPKVENDDALESLRSQFATMTQRATAAEQRASEAEQAAQTATQRVQRLETEVVGSQLDTVLSGIAAAQAEAIAAEQECTAAFEAGDGAAIARAQRKIAAAEARVVRLTEAKDDLEEAAKRRPDPSQKPRQPAPQPRQPADPVEAFITRAALTPKSADFIRRHPETATDQRANARMLAAHNMAVADGIEIESDEYFRRIEEGISMKKAPAAEPQPQRRPSAPAAPAAGGGGGGLNGGGTEVRLTKREAQSATDGTLVWNWDDPGGKFKKGDPIGLAEMARRKHHGQKAGLYDRSFTEQ